MSHNSWRVIVALVLVAVIYWVRRSRRRLQDVRDEDSSSRSTAPWPTQAPLPSRETEGQATEG